MTLPLTLPLGLRPMVMLKCPAVGLYVAVSDSDTQPKLALVLALGSSIRGCFAQGRKQTGHEAPQPEGIAAQRAAIPSGNVTGKE